MIKVGLAGGIGSGKSTVARAFATVGVSVYNCDMAARGLMESDVRIISALKRRFGDGLYSYDGKLDRKALAGIIFNDKAELAFVDSVVHPVVADDFTKWAENRAGLGEPWALCESAILFESGLANMMDKVIVAYLPLELRIERTMERDGATRDKVMERIANQASADEVVKRADYVLSPDDRHLIMPDILRIDGEMRKLGASMWTQGEVLH